jgi:hypothetical protein
VVRNEATDVERIVEHGDARPEELAIREVNSGVYVFDYRELSRVLEALRANNRQSELYLTDTIAALRASGKRVGAQRAADPIEVMGINDPAQLRDAERIHRERQPPAPPERKRPRVEIPDDDEDLKLGRGSVLDRLVERERLAHGARRRRGRDEEDGEDEEAEDKEGRKRKRTRRRRRTPARSRTGAARTDGRRRRRESEPAPSALDPMTRWGGRRARAADATGGANG